MEDMHNALKSGLAGTGKEQLLQKVWDKVDTDGNGTLDEDEVRSQSHALNVWSRCFLSS